MSYSFFFFFSSRRRHTRLQGDWSSDVCSSDLEFDVPVSVHFVAKDAHPPHEGVNVRLVGHALSAPVRGWQRRRRPGVHDLGERRGRCRLVGEAGIGLLFPAIVISVPALRILPLPRGDGSNRGTYERQQHEWPHGTSRVVLCSVCGTPY